MNWKDFTSKCAEVDDSDNPNQRLHNPLPYARYVLEHYGQPLVRP